jgi:hypothetical protein
MRPTSPLRLAAAALLLVASACGNDAPAGPRGASATPGKVAPREAAAQLSATEATSGPVCSPTGAHGRHESIAADCRTCHACGGAYEFTALTLPGGTTTAGGQIVRGTPTTCSVGCHNVSGTTPDPIAWTAVGPLACTSCHVQPSGAVTKHAVAQADPLADRDGCQACHVLDRHVSGVVRIAAGEEIIEASRTDPEALAVACKSCHDGAGKSIGGSTPPLLVGWSDTVSGDFHGARVGTGSSLAATLNDPYVRGQPPLPCTSCHEPHQSDNSYLFAAPASPAPIDRAGVGAEQLCMTCHGGERHGWCISCHAGIVRVPGDPMPAGAPCFYCHGHDGIINFYPPSDYQHDGSEEFSERCYHCHTSWAPPPVEYVAPQIVNNFVNAAATYDSATITWTTNEPATGFVEWGLGAGPLDRITGGRTLTTAHSVTLTGLAGATTYSFRVRSADAFRNLTRSQIRTFQTEDPNAPPSPPIVPEPDYTSCGSPAHVTLEWQAVANGGGNLIEYQVIVDDSPLFDSPNLDSGWITVTQYPASFAVTTFWSTYYWRVRARDALYGATSPWSATDDFRVNRYRLGYCP